MITYPKIDSVYKRDPENNYKTFLNEYSRPEFDYLAGLRWYGTEKVDGTNIRISPSEIGGRTDMAQIPTFLIPRLQEIQARLQESDLPEETILFGEGYGAKIQKGGGNYIPDGQDFVLFDVHINSAWQERDNVDDIAESLGIKSVPTLTSMPLYRWGEFMGGTDPLYEESLLHPGAPNEGVVLRPLVELQTRRGSRLITKLKFADYESRVKSNA